jgi:hypothetical protein
MFNNKEFLTSDIIYKKRNPAASYKELSDLMARHADRQQIALLRESRVTGMLTVDFLRRDKEPGSLRFAYIDKNWVNVGGVDASQYEKDPGLQKLFVSAYRTTPRKVLSKLAEQLSSLGIFSADFVTPSPEIASSFYTDTSFLPTAPVVSAPTIFEAPEEDVTSPQLGEGFSQDVAKMDTDEIARQTELAKNTAISELINKVINGAIKGLPAYLEVGLPVLIGIRAEGKLSSTQEKDLRELLQDQIKVNHLFDCSPLPECHTALLIYNLSAMLQSYIKHQPKTGLFPDPDRIVFDKQKIEGVQNIKENEELKSKLNEIIQSVAAMMMPSISAAPTMQAQPDTSAYPDPSAPAVYSQGGYI